jgi:hypothetical protein
MAGCSCAIPNTFVFKNIICPTNYFEYSTELSEFILKNCDITTIYDYLRHRGKVYMDSNTRYKFEYAISESGLYSLMYASYLGGRFELGEPAIYSDPIYSEKYITLL